MQFLTLLSIVFAFSIQLCPLVQATTRYILGEFSGKVGDSFDNGDNIEDINKVHDNNFGYMAYCSGQAQSRWGPKVNACSFEVYMLIAQSCAKLESLDYGNLEYSNLFDDIGCNIFRILLKKTSMEILKKIDELKDETDSLNSYQNSSLTYLSKIANDVKDKLEMSNQLKNIYSSDKTTNGNQEEIDHISQRNLADNLMINKYWDEINDLFIGGGYESTNING
ncbi:hypothetical protein AYI68_g7301 [Smittium mucronatum]|uniref:Uncharacterized protein n=1 Tax=Smittium mucronatum TaxID=133383 RepID=A0A1R0GP28_9FUNG|nr:hypothetical protein AYI68_g7301 [Smittium mucronatum]